MLSYKEVNCLNCIAQAEPFIFTTSSEETIFHFFVPETAAVINNSSKQQTERLRGRLHALSFKICILFDALIIIDLFCAARFIVPKIKKKKS